MEQKKRNDFNKSVPNHRGFIVRITDDEKRNGWDEEGLAVYLQEREQAAMSEVELSLEHQPPDFQERRSPFRR